MTTATLPDKPSELIRVALADLRKVEAMPETYRVDMNRWHHPMGGKCSVCLAGSVIAQTLGEDPAIDTDHDEIDVDAEGLGDKLSALNDFRMGDVHWGVHTMLGESTVRGLPEELHTALIAPYDAADPEAFHRDMAKLADDLEAAGL